MGKKDIEVKLKKDQKSLKKKNETPVKICPLGGLETIGENMMYIEYKEDIIIIDAGMLFPGGEMYGVDYIIPDISYLMKNKKKIKGIFITHGHMDHIGALKHILPKLNYPKIYSRNLTIRMIQKQFDDKRKLKKLQYQVIDPDKDIISLGCFDVEFFRVNHSIPEAVGLAIHTPKGLVAHTGDFKIDFTPDVEDMCDLSKLARIGEEGVKLMFSDSTSVVKDGKAPSEKEISNNLETIIKNCNSRLIVSTFSSLIGRISKIIEYAVKADKIVFLSGRSMRENVALARELGYINAPQGTIRNLNNDARSLPDEKVVILSTGSQGEEYSALNRMANGSHQQIEIRKGDKILLSSKTIPGNGEAIVNMINNLIAKGADVVTSDDMDIHVSGHAHREDAKMMLSLVKPENFVPVHGELFMRHEHKKIASEMGIKDDNIFLIENGDVLNMYENTIEVMDSYHDLDTVIVDGRGVGSISGEYVMKAREIMSTNGVVSLIFKVDSENKKLVGNIQIESRGFVYSGEVKKIHTDIVKFVKRKYYKFYNPKMPVKVILKKIKRSLSSYLTKKIGRVPMIIPMYVYINTSSEEESDDTESLVGLTLEQQGN